MKHFENYRVSRCRLNTRTKRRLRNLMRRCFSLVRPRIIQGGRFEENAMFASNPRTIALALFAAAAIMISAGARASASNVAHPQDQPTAPSQLAKPVGTVRAIAGNTITLTTAGGTEVNVSVQDSTH